MQQEHIEKSKSSCRDAYRPKRVEIHAAHFDVLHAPFGERMQRSLSRTNAPLRPDGPIELVFDLQQRGGKLPVAFSIANADGLVRRIRFGKRMLQRPCVAS